MGNQDIVYTTVIIIGNGPSAVSLSYLLSGNQPFYNGGQIPNEYLQYKLEADGRSLLEQDLEYLSAGLEGRSSNPVALLFDTLTHPNADMGLESPSLLDWHNEPDSAIPHVVLGRGPPGGVWQSHDNNMQTISLGTWMELPNMPFREWCAEYRRCLLEKSLVPMQWVSNRASMNEVGQYYTKYVKHHNLGRSFKNFHTVTSVQRVLDCEHENIDCENGEVQIAGKSNAKFVWEVCGQLYQGKNAEDEPCVGDFCFRAPNLVLATGTSDMPNKLNIPGESLSHVIHSISELEQAVQNGIVTPTSEPLVIIGAGLSAADAVQYALISNLNIIHVFHRAATDQTLIFNKLPLKMYPEYHSVYKMMKGEHESDNYKPLAEHHLCEIMEDGQVVVEHNNDSMKTVINAGLVLVLIGARPNLSFLPKEGTNLGVYDDMPIDSRNNPVDIDPFTYESVKDPGLYAMGPLVGDNFVRFLQGGSLAIANNLKKKLSTHTSFEG